MEKNSDPGWKKLKKVGSVKERFVKEKLPICLLYIKGAQS
jgi:hypothetical protein